MCVYTYVCKGKLLHNIYWTARMRIILIVTNINQSYMWQSHSAFVYTYLLKAVGAKVATSQETPLAI